MAHVLRDRDVVSSFFWAAVGLFFAAGGHLYALKRAGIPGPGFLPFFAGIILLGLSLVLLISALRRRRAHPVSTVPEACAPRRVELRKSVQVFATLLFYALALESLGFAATTFIFMIFFLRLESRRWPTVVPVALGFTAFFFILFKVLLNVPLPAGILGY